ncbi:MAG: hypothetical protein OEU46_01970 [Alphaproteobacteria bacterium]|nr:hypothetical protein [Alphaproteobacteria bacterium]
MKINPAHPSTTGVPHKSTNNPANSGKPLLEPSADTSEATTVDAVPEQARSAPAHVARELLLAQSVTDGTTDRNLFGRLVSLIARGKPTEGLLGAAGGNTRDETAGTTQETKSEPPAAPDGTG